jgi:putative transposase
LIGPINIKTPSTHDRGGQGIYFRSDLLPHYIKRIKSYGDWQTRDLSKEGYIYIWADGIYFTSGVMILNNLLLIFTGVTSHDNKVFLAIEDGYRKTDERQRNSVH